MTYRYDESIVGLLGPPAEDSFPTPLPSLLSLLLYLFHLSLGADFSKQHGRQPRPSPTPFQATVVSRFASTPATLPRSTLGAKGYRYSSNPVMDHDKAVYHYD